MEKKKQKIIVSIVCVLVILAGIVTSIILMLQKRFDLTPNEVVHYNNHTEMTITSLPSGMILADNGTPPTYYSNGTVIIQDTFYNKYGVFSYIENELITPQTFEANQIEPVAVTNNGTATGEYFFRTESSEGQIKYYCDDGDTVNINYFDDNQNFAYIKERKLEISEKRSGVKVSAKNRFRTKKIYISDIEYMMSYFVEDDEYYELWKLTDTDGNEYTNLYEVDDDDRDLVQTIDNTIGNTMDTEIENISSIFFLTNGEPRILTREYIYTSTNEYIYKITVYDEDFDKKGSSTIDYDSTVNAYVEIGNILFIQYLKQSNEKDYDYSTTTNGETVYYNLINYKINLKNGKKSEIDFDYVIEDGNLEFNNKTILLQARKVDDKQLGDLVMILVNDDMETKSIDYTINSIKEISEDRYIVESDNGLILIDEDYDKICYLGKYDEYFTTENAIVLKSATTGYSYVCSHDGVVVKKYLNNQVINAYHGKYYIVKDNTTINEIEYEQYHLESLGYRYSTPLYSKAINESIYTYNGTEYVAYSQDILASGISIITRVRQVGSEYTYEFYNLDGKLLLSLDNFAFANRPLLSWGYTDEDNAILYISTAVGDIGYTILVDR